LVLRIRVVPRSGKTGFVVRMDNGVYKVRLKAPPVDGRANTELVRWLAEQFSTGKDGISIISGALSRTKTVEVAGIRSEPEWYNG
jgi:uncharacterized protein (TIGR00251 family)